MKTKHPENPDTGAIASLLNKSSTAARGRADREVLERQEMEGGARAWACPLLRASRNSATTSRQTTRRECR
jgi:hypothetical protein